MKNTNLKGSLFTKKTLVPSEANVSKAIEGFLNSRKIYNDRLNSGKVEVRKRYFCKTIQKWKEFYNWVTLCKEGTPDRMFIVEGRIYYVEVKQLGKKPTSEQINRHQELRASGAVVMIADSIESFILAFNEMFPALAMPVFSR